MKYFTILMVLVAGLVHGQERAEKLRNCLYDCYRIESSQMAPIMDVFKPLLDDPQKEVVIDDFIAQSESLHIDFTKIPKGIVSETDPVLVAPEWHHVLYENPYVRVLVGDLKAHEFEPAHMHSLKRILVIIYGAKFEIECDGKKEIGEWPAGSYLLDPDKEAFSSLNLSDHLYRGLSFEIKE